MIDENIRNTLEALLKDVESAIAVPEGRVTVLRLMQNRIRNILEDSTERALRLEKIESFKRKYSKNENEFVVLEEDGKREMIRRDDKHSAEKLYGGDK